jgi:hypothetical protein
MPQSLFYTRLHSRPPGDLGPGGRVDFAEPVALLDEEVARIDVSVVLYHHIAVAVPAPSGSQSIGLPVPQRSYLMEKSLEQIYSRSTAARPEAPRIRRFEEVGRLGTGSRHGYCVCWSHVVLRVPGALTRLSEAIPS